ncbi:MAG: M48 family metallopeptidase [Pseudomonadota bacterium]|nr:M48 family metallopeptidase [Pseudomonadota bacterium]
MSFYQNQENARRKTGLLVFYFVTAVVLIVVAVNGVLYGCLLVAGHVNLTPAQWLQTPLCWGTALATLGAIALGSLKRMAQLRRGGAAVAVMAGGTPLDPASSDPRERVLINVVEEMAIASGTPVPRLFILRQEAGINAFVAGTSASNTVLAVTQGTLDKLTRDELQGVVGHEFSHILNGDMQLNMRLIGILAGILFIGQIGEFLLRGERRRHYYRRRGNRDGIQAAALGLALMIIGYVGLFFGRLIKAAISRQREFLADASSVQFTRNPEGIASALFAIQHYSGHSLLLSPHAEDMNHMCFGESVKMRLSGMLATHPPIEQRVRAIDHGLWPRLKARFRQRDPGPAGPGADPNTSESTPAMATVTGAVAQAVSALAEPGSASIAVNPAAVKASVGTPTPDHMDYARQLHQQLPDSLRQQAHQPAGAEILIYALLLLESPQLDRVPVAVDTAALEQRQHLAELGAGLRLPLLDICLATLKSLPPDQRQNILRNAVGLIKLDQRVTLSEFVYCYLLQQSLQQDKRPARTIKSLQTVIPALATLFSAVVKVSGNSPQQQQITFQRIMAYYDAVDHSHYLQQPPTPKTLNRALQQLARLSPLLKQPVVDACVDCILGDGKAVLKELELLRALCEALECPMPPILLHQG